MENATDLMIGDLKKRYAGRQASAAFTRLYDDRDFGHMFSVLHQCLNQHFEGINDRAKTTHHYWADNSREMLALIDELEQDLRDLNRAGIEVELDQSYRKALERCQPWLSWSGGSTVPDDFELIDVVRFEPVLLRTDSTVTLKKAATPARLTLVGEGSYATVYSFVDPDYGIKFAVKRAKRDLSERDLHRFKQEFEVMRGLSFPYIVEVYGYDEARDEYRMEFCDETLRAYVARRNNSLSFSSRKRIALQFLYGINYLHGEGLLHRDISLQNVLLKVYAKGAVLVKLSDFGLVKDRASEFTRTDSEMRGTIRDPLLDSFKNYGVVNEIYSIGWVLSYIFTGRERLATSAEPLGAIIDRCAANSAEQRYQDVLTLISDVELLAAVSTDAPA
ncbi:MAG: protein kinase family protein [Bifidobacteriaceae bacterium]|nr:protein kinase family protein [Bifidobacteriaceae bacterium]